MYKVASHQSHRDGPCENTGAVWTNNPSVEGITHRTIRQMRDAAHYCTNTHATHAELHKTRTHDEMGKMKRFSCLLGSKPSNFNGKVFQK